MTRPSRSALIVSDSAPLRRYIAASLTGARFTCVEAASGFRAIDLTSNRRFALYVVDLDMALSDGLSIFAITLTGGQGGSSQAVIGVAQDPASARNREPWSNAQFSGVLAKPFQPDDIIAAAQAALKAKPDPA